MHDLMLFGIHSTEYADRAYPTSSTEASPVEMNWKMIEAYLW